ncbi:hypothetical protein C8Q76DRAFT_801811 [Earliella scabrosa]|nr:hypothetical protein C8Q76DRAFT_801811 [Earliella scabrosa]
MSLQSPLLSDEPAKDSLDVIEEDTVGLEIFESTIVALQSMLQDEIVPAAASRLDNAVDVLIEILKKVQDSTPDVEASKALCEQSRCLNAAIGSVKMIIQERLGAPHPPDDSSVERQLYSNDGEFNARITSLERSLSEGNHLAGETSSFSLGSQTTEKVSRLADDLRDACRNFQTQDGITIEAIVRRRIREVMSEMDYRVLQQLCPLDSASYRSVDNGRKAKYLLGTRMKAFREIDSWVNNSKTSADHRVFVLIGAAGTGKSTICSELCRRLSEQDLLGASFFFTRGVQGPNSARSFFNTIAFQLATLQPDSLNDRIVSVCKKHLQNKQSPSIEDACEDLVRGPLLALPKNGSSNPIFLVVDALDECTSEGSDYMPNLLHLLLSCADTPSPLRIFLTVRPQSNDVRKILDSRSFVLRRSLHDLVDMETRDGDVRALLTHTLSLRPLTLSWYQNRQVIQRLVDQSKGMLMYASAAMEFLRQGDPTHEVLDERLSRLEGVRHSNDRILLVPHITLPQLDSLYLTVLEVALPQMNLDDATRAKQIALILSNLAVLPDCPGFTPRVLARLTNISCEEYMSVLEPLRAVIMFDLNNTDSDIRIMHFTFRHFLTHIHSYPSLQFLNINITEAYSRLEAALLRRWADVHGSECVQVGRCVVTDRVAPEEWQMIRYAWDNESLETQLIDRAQLGQCYFESLLSL